MISSYLIYHPERSVSEIGKLRVYHDNFKGNEDPYVWNEKFLHTYCHITQLSNDIGQINFWISGDKYPNFTKLFCDCVFVIEDKLMWKHNNHIDRSDEIIDNNQAYEFHYKWANKPFNHHHYKNRARYTLKADKEKSFQPQSENRNLIDILPFLNSKGVKTDELIQSITSKRGSRPYKLSDNLRDELYSYLQDNAKIKLKGMHLKDKHPKRNSISIEFIGNKNVSTNCH